MLTYVYMDLCFAQGPWVENQSPYVGPHSDNVEILPITLHKEGFIKLLRGLGTTCYPDNRNFVMIK